MPEVLFEKFPIPTEFPVTVASEELAKNVYHTIVGNSGVKWYIAADIENPADHIYCTDSADWDKAGDGFGGRNITIKLTSGETEVLRGGWHSNAEALYQDTDTDLRDKHKTFVVVAERRDAEFLYNVLYADDTPQVSEFRRGEKIAKELATESGTPLVVFSRSAAGAIIGMIYP